MSGGKFMYIQRSPEWDNLFERIDMILAAPDNEYSEDAIKDFIASRYIIRVGLLYAEQIDLLLSGDISDETFSKNIKEQSLEIVRRFRPNYQ